MDKEDFLHYFQDINFRYNDCMMYDNLTHMLDELIEENHKQYVEMFKQFLEELERERNV